MEMSMMGSGIYVTDHTLTVTCEECDKEWEHDFVADDWGTIREDLKCECGHEWTFITDIQTAYEPDPDYDPREDY